MALVVILSQSCTKPETITAEEASEVIRRFDTGWKTKNVATVDSVLSRQYTYFTQSGGTFDRANIVQTAGSPDYQLQEMERKQISISISGNTAVVNTTWRGKGSYFGNPFDDTQRCSVTLVKEKGKIRILAEHCTPIK